MQNLNYCQQSGKTSFIILIVGALMFVIIGSSLSGEYFQKASSHDERNKLRSQTDSEEYNRPAYEGIAANIRNSLNQQSKLSERAKSVYITVTDGMIVLNGQVKSRIEQVEVLKLASEQAGMAKVINQLKIVPAQ